VREADRGGGKVKKTIFGAFLLMLIGIVASAVSVSAEKLGDGYSILGYNAGWVLVVIAIVIAILYWGKIVKIPKTATKLLTTIIALFMIIGIAMVGVEVETEAPPLDTVEGMEFEITPQDATAGGSDIDSVTWDADKEVYTIPLQLTGNGELETNLTSLNFTIKPKPSAGQTTENLAVCHFKTDYQMKYAGEYVLRDMGDTYYANWTHGSSQNAYTTDDYSGWESMALSGSAWANVTFKFDSVLAGAEGFSTELDTIGDTGSWTITFYNDDGTWSESFTVVWIVIEL